MSNSNNSINFEHSLDKLEEIVDNMENGDLTLEDSLKAFEQGIKLTRECQSALTLAEQKVQVLIENNGQLDIVSLDEDTQNNDRITLGE